MDRVRPDVDLREPTGEGVPPVLMLHSENDPATAIEGARIAHHQFRGSRTVTVTDEGDHGLYGAGNACVDGIVEKFLIGGVLPEEDLTCQGGTCRIRLTCKRPPSTRRC